MRITKADFYTAATIQNVGNFQIVLFPTVVINFKTCKNACRCWSIAVNLSWLLFQLGIEIATGEA